MRERLASVYSGPVAENAPLAPLTRFGLGGSADWLFTPDREAEVGPLLALLHEEGMPVTLLGDGCNVLIRDGGIRGAVLRIARGLSHLHWEGDIARCGAGLASALLARRSVEEHRGGLEWAASLPGNLGGALRMNAGAYGGCLAEVFHACRGWSFEGERVELGKADVRFDYRFSSLSQDLVITEIELKLPLLPETEWEDSRTRHQELMDRRAARHPAGMRTAGSTFKNPPELSAGRLLEEAGLKNRRVGGARVSDHHANFIRAEEGATAADVEALMRLMIDEVERMHGVRLRPEVKVYGEEA